MGRWRPAQPAKVPTAATPAAPKPPTTTQNLQSVVDAGLNYGKNNPTLDAGNEFVRNKLGASDFSGPGGNAILDDLQHRLSTASFTQPTDLLNQFLGVGADGKYPGGGSGQSTGQPVFYSSGGSGGLGYGSGAGGGGGVPPDATGNGLFAQQVKQMFDPANLDPAHNPTLQPMIDALAKNSLAAHQRALAGIDAQAEGAGRFGGGAYQDELRQAQDSYNSTLQGSEAGIYMQDRQNAQNQMMSALGLVNTRDIAAMNDATQRAGISSSAGASAAGIEAQLKLGLRAQDLQAIQQQQQQQQFGLSTLGSLGQAFDSSQQGALNSIPGLAGIGLGGINAAGGAAGSMANLDAANAAANASRAASRASYNLGEQNLQFQQLQYNNGLPQQHINDYLHTLGVIGSMGGDTTQVNPGQFGVNPGGNPAMAGLLGGLGGAAATYGYGRQMGFTGGYQPDPAAGYNAYNTGALPYGQ